MSRFLIAVLICPTVLFSTPAWAEDPAYVAAISVFRTAENTQRFFANSYGYAVFPTVGKGGIGIGGAYGRGKVYRAGAATGTTSLANVSIGFQLGGQAFSEIIFFKDKEAYDKFTRGSFQFSAQATAVLITLGAQAQAGSTGSSAGAGVGTSTSQAAGNYVYGMAVFVHPKGGLMYEASIAGQKFGFRPLDSSPG
jgi:lipid-binding SYLF domain-containing protein